MSKKRRILRLAGFLVINLFITLFVAAAAFVYGWTRMATGLPDLHGWHTDHPDSEFSTHDVRPGYTLDNYLTQEATVFAELDRLVAGPWTADAGSGRKFNRFSATSVSNPATHQTNWNRTFILEAPEPVGGALLIHGLSDAPYSLRALGQRLHREGYTVIGLRVPGHGTCPSALRKVSWPDWAAAVRVGAQGLRARVPADRPIILVGYSNGAALAIDYAADAADDPTLPRAAALVLVSPMIGITPKAKLMELYPLVARLSRQDKFAWSAIEEEIDPYKYGSWPHNASLQAWRITRRVERRVAALQAAGRMNQIPPILAVQSAVDATVRTPALMDNLLDRLAPSHNQLILFDVNRASWLDSLLSGAFEQQLFPRLERQNLPYSLVLVTNSGPESRDVVARTWDSNRNPAEQDLAAAWPVGVFSLSHVALPIPPDDPIYGTAEATRAGGLPLGTLSLRGEHRVLALSETLLMRMRHNPFYAWTEDRIMHWLDELDTPRADPSATGRGSPPPPPG